MTSVDETGVRSPEDRSRSDLQRLARGSALNVAASGVAATLNIVLPVVIARSLTKADAGLFFQATALFAILLNIGTLGADTGVLRSLPRALVLSQRRDLRRYLVVAVLPALAVTLILIGVLAAVAGPIGDLVMGDSSGDQDFRTVMLVLLPWVPVAVVYVIIMSASRGLDSVRPLVFIEKIGRNALETGAAGITAGLTTSVALIVTAWVAPYLVALMVVGVWVARRLRRITARIGPDEAPPTPWPQLALEFWRFSGPRAVSRIFTIALQRFDILIVGALRGPADAAVYAAATRFLILGLMFVQAIQQVMAPKISETLALGQNQRAETIYRTTTAWLTLVSWPIYLMAGLYASLLLGVFGPGYEEGAAAAALLCGAMLVATACGPVDSMLLMAGRSVASLVNTGVALVINVGLDLVLVPRYGVTGAALGWSVSILIKNLMALWQVNRSNRLHPIGPGTLAAMAACTLSFGVVAGGVRLLVGPEFISFLLAGLVGTGVFVLLVRRWYDELEIAALAAVVKRRQRR